MKRTYQIGTAVILILGVLAFQNCGQAPTAIQRRSPPFEKVASSDLESRYQDIRTLAAQDLSCGNDADCTVVGVGSRNCGLPSEYAVTSRNGNLAAIDKLNAELSSLETQYMAENDLVAECGASEPPVAVCVSNRCAAQ